jgi:hypothetical protein
LSRKHLKKNALFSGSAVYQAGHANFLANNPLREAAEADQPTIAALQNQDWWRSGSALGARFCVNGG